MEEYRNSPALTAWREGMLSHSEALSYLIAQIEEVTANLMVEEATRGEERMNALMEAKP